MLQFDIYLPLKYNDGKDIEPYKFDTTRRELLEQFGGFSVFPASTAIEGWWKFGHRIFKDEIKIFRVIAPRDDEIFWRSYKAKLKERFTQQEIFIVKTSVHIL